MRLFNSDWTIIMIISRIYMQMYLNFRDYLTACSNDTKMYGPSNGLLSFTEAFMRFSSEVP